MRYNAAMSLTNEEVQHIADLAHLRITDDEREQYRRQLQDILDYASRLREVNTDSIVPTTSVLPLGTALREDAPKASLPREAALANSPKTDRDMFVIPAVFE